MGETFKKLKIGDKKPTEKKEDNKVNKPEDNKVGNDDINFKFGIFENSDKTKEENGKQEDGSIKKKVGMKDALQEHYKK